MMLAVLPSHAEGVLSARRVISTLPDGRVSVMGPSARMVRLLKEGGGLYCIAHSPALDTYRYGLAEHMDGHPNIGKQLRLEIERTGLIPMWLAREYEIKKHVRDPAWCTGRSNREAMAAKWVDAKTHGRLEEREAVMLIWEYTRAAGAIHHEACQPEIVHESELQWPYRKAWRRSLNGGPVWIDEDEAQKIDETRMWERYDGKAA